MREPQSSDVEHMQGVVTIGAAHSHKMERGSGRSVTEKKFGGMWRLQKLDWLFIGLLGMEIRKWGRGFLADNLLSGSLHGLDES